jgi:hypothetical protein
MSSPRSFSVVEIIDICNSGDLTQLQSALATSNIDCSNLDINLFHGAVRHPAIIDYLSNPARQLYKAFNHGLNEVHVDAFAGRSAKVLDAITQTPYLLLISSLKGYGVFYWASLGRNYALIDILLEKIPRTKKDEYIEQIIAAADYLTEIYTKANDSTTAYLIETKASIYQKQTSTPQTSITITELKESDMDYAGSHMEDISIIVTEAPATIEPEFFSKPKPNINQTVAAWGFFPCDVRHDGNCQFHAITDQIALHREKFLPQHQQHNHITLRQLAVNHLRENLKLYSAYVPEIHEKYLHQMETKNQWGDHLTIVALAAELNVNIAVYSTDAPVAVTKITDACATLFILHQNRTHYLSLRIIDQDLINNTILKQISDDIQISTLARDSIKVSTATNGQLPLQNVTSHILLYPRREFFFSPNSSTTFRNKELSDDELSEPDDMIANISTFEVAKRIANPETDLIEETDITESHHLSDFSKAIMRADNELMDALLLSDPGLINSKTDDAYSMFFWSGLTNNDYLITLCDEPTSEQRNDFIEGAVQRANHLNWEDVDHPECINAHEYAIKALLSAIDNYPEENYFSSLHELYLQFLPLLIKYKNELLQQQNEAEAILVLQKAITNFPAQHASVTSLKTLQTELEELQTKMEVEDISILLGHATSTRLFDQKKRQFNQSKSGADVVKQHREKKQFR